MSFWLPELPQTVGHVVLMLVQALLFMALNAVLNTVGISITRPQNNDEWSIADGRSLVRFRDGVVGPLPNLHVASFVCRQPV